MAESAFKPFNSLNCLKGKKYCQRFSIELIIKMLCYFSSMCCLWNTGFLLFQTSELEKAVHASEFRTFLLRNHTRMSRFWILIIWEENVEEGGLTYYFEGSHEALRLDLRNFICMTLRTFYILQKSKFRHFWHFFQLCQTLSNIKGETYWQWFR